MTTARRLAGALGAALGALMIIAAPFPAAQGHTPSLAPASRRDIVAAARGLLATLPAEPGEIERLYGISQRRLALEPFDSAHRADWSYWPRKRVGVSLQQLSAPQKARVHDLLSTILSAKGHLQVVQTMQLEEVLRAVETAGFQRNAETYVLAIFGDPSLDHPWGLRFEGHHVSVNLTFAASSRFSATPLFLGAAPAEVRSGPMAGFRPLGAEEDLALKLARSLTPAQAGRGVGPHAPGEILSSQYQRDRSGWSEWTREVAAEGVAWESLDAAQRRMLETLIEGVVQNLRPEISNAYGRLIDKTSARFLWLGPTALGKPHYFRITSGDFVYEFDNVQGDANHIHSVWRDRSNDLGADALQTHYKAAH